MIHTEHVTVEAWSMSCVEGDCDHIDENGQPEDLSSCPSSLVQVCVECMVRAGHPRDTAHWEGPFTPWPHPDTEMVPVRVPPRLFKPSPEPTDSEAK